MPKLPAEKRREVYDLYCLNKDADYIYETVFRGNASIIKLQSLKNLLRNFAKMESTDTLYDYLSCSNEERTKLGRIPMIGAKHDRAILSYVKEKRSTTLHSMAKRLYADFEEEFKNIPDNSTIGLHLKKLKQKRHRLNRENIHKDFGEQVRYLEDVGFLSPSRIVDIDGIHFNPKDYLQKYGWSTIGEEAYIFQVIIRAKTYAVHAALTDRGFLAWDIFEKNVTRFDVIEFLMNKVLPKFPPDAILILDNAKNQNNNDVHEVMMNSFGGAYRFVPKYSPELKPIERAFSMVRTIVRDHENDTNFSDIELINYASHS